MLERALRTRAHRREMAALVPAESERERRSWTVAVAVGDLVRPFLKEVMFFARTQSGSAQLPAESVYNELRTRLEEAIERMRKMRVNSSDMEDIKYALVAFADERMLQDSPYADFWQSHRLQMAYFSETRGGEGFFERLRELKRQTSRHGALRVYYICLLLGFHGMYRNMDGLGRENTIEEVRVALHALLPQHRGTFSLSPHGQRPNEPATDRRRSQMLRWVAILTAAAAITFYGGMRVTLDARERTLSNRVQQVLLDLGATPINIPD